MFVRYIKVIKVKETVHNPAGLISQLNELINLIELCASILATLIELCVTILD